MEMKESFLVLLQILLAVNTILAGKYQLNEGFNVMSTLNATVNLQAKAKLPTGVIQYYVSSNSASWSTSNEMCKNLFGPGASLLTLRTKEEWEFIKVDLESYGSGGLYWIGGEYDPESDKWIWLGTSEAISSFVRWAPGEPMTNPTEVHKAVTLYHGNRYDASLRTDEITQLHRFICEERR